MPPDVTCSVDDQNAFFSDTDINSFTIDEGITVTDTDGNTTPLVLTFPGPLPFSLRGLVSVSSRTGDEPGILNSFVNNGNIIVTDPGTGRDGETGTIPVIVFGRVDGGFLNNGEISGGGTTSASVVVFNGVTGGFTNTENGAIANGVQIVRVLDGGFTNRGTISGRGIALGLFGGPDPSIFDIAVSGDFVNTGTIEGQSFGVRQNPLDGQVFESFRNGDGALIDGGITGLRLETTGDFTNHGTISGGIDAITAVAEGVFLNTGLIEGGSNEVLNALIPAPVIQLNSVFDNPPVTRFINAEGGVIRALDFNDFSVVEIGKTETGFENHGTISGPSTPLSVVGIGQIVNGDVINTGKIETDTGFGLVIGNFSDTVMTDFSNSGMIAGRVGVNLGRNVDVTGTFKNSGVITGVDGAPLDSVGFQSSAQFDNPLLNSGTIIGDIGIRFDLTPANSISEVLTNTGDITGRNGTAILFGPGDDVLNHDAEQGSIIGSVDGGDDRDTFNLTAGRFDLTNLINFETTNIEAGATGFGSGDVNGNVVVANGATLAPGNSIGTMHVGGDLVLSNGSTLAVEIEAPDAADLLVVEGATALAGNLVVTGLGALTAFAETDRYVVVESAGGVTGAFENVTDDIPDLDVRFGVESIGGSAETVVLGLRADTEDVSDKAIHPNTLQAAADVARSFTAELTRRVETDAGIDPVTSAQFATKGTASLGYRDRVWGTVFGSFRDIGTTSTTTGYDATAKGLAAGYERVIERETGALRYGFATGASTSDINSGASSADVETVSFGVYGGVDHRNWVLSGALSFGLQDYEIDRVIPVGPGSTTAFGLADGNVFAASARLGFDAAASLGFEPQSGTRILPYLQFDHVSLSRDGFTETGAGALNLSVSPDHFTQNVASLGLAVSTSLQDGDAVFRPFLDARWIHVLDNQSATSTAVLAGTPGATFVTPGVTETRDRFGLSAGVEADIGENTSIQVRYDGAFGGGFADHRASLDLRIRF